MTRKLFITAALALAAFMAASGTASAFTATVAPAGAITSVSRGLVTFSSGTTTITCRVTLRGSLNATVTLTAGQSLGRVSAVEIAECSSGATVTVLSLPYNLNYQSVAGTLPNAVTAINFRVDAAAFNLSLFGRFINCLYSGNQPARLAVRGTNPYETGDITTTAASLPLVRGAGCPSEGEMRGVFSLTAQRISVR
jgi:hypothetical protein